MTKSNNNKLFSLSPKLAFLLVSFCLGELGDGLNIFQGIYLVGIGWNEGSVGAALSLMGLTALLVQPLAGDWVDKAAVNRRVFLTVASIVTAISASTILRVQPGNHVADHWLIYGSKIIEGIASSFIGPCLAALTLASFGPNHFDAVMASNLFWGHVGSVVAAILAGIVAYFSFPDIKYCFLVIGASALVAVSFIPSLPEGDPMMGRGFQGHATMDENGNSFQSSEYKNNEDNMDTPAATETTKLTITPAETFNSDESDGGDSACATPPTAASYWEVFFDSKTCILCWTGFFFHFANANVLLVLGELMGNGGGPEGPSRSVIPLTAGAIVTAQLTMAMTTWAGDTFTGQGMGRKPLFMAALLTLPIRCALIIWFKDAGNSFLLSTQILDGIGGGLFALVHPYLIADITFGTGRFNVVSKYIRGLMCSFPSSATNLLTIAFLLHSLLFFFSLLKSGIDGIIFWNGSDAVKFSGSNGGGTLWTCGKSPRILAAIQCPHSVVFKHARNLRL